MTRKRLVVAIILGFLLAAIPGGVSAHGGIDELDPRVVGPTLVAGLLLFVGIFGFMLTGPSWLLGVPEDSAASERVIDLRDVRKRQEKGGRQVGQQSTDGEEETGWRGRATG